MKRILKAAMVGAFTLACAGAASAAEPMAAPSDRALARAVIIGQIDALRADDAERVYRLAGQRLRRRFPTPQIFLTITKRGFGPIYEGSHPTFTRTSRADDDHIAQELLVTGPKGRTWAVLYTLERAGEGDWRITGVYLKPTGLKVA